MQIKNYPIPKKLNLSLMLLLTVANLFAMFILPLWLLPQSFWWAMILIPIVLATNTYWSLIHEGIHFIFYPDKTINNVSSRIMSIVLGTVFQIVQFGHLVHHAYNRTNIDRPEVFEPNTQNYWKRNIEYYFKLTVGLYIVEFLGPLLAYLPQPVIARVADKLYGFNPQFDKLLKNRLLSAASLRAIRIDATIMYVLYAVAFICYGHYAWVLLLVMLARGFMLSFADNLPHYGTKLDKIRYSYNLSLPPLLQKWLLNFNLHRVHHEQPMVPWRSLPAAKIAMQDHCDINYFKQGIRQYKGLIDIEQLQ